MYSRAGKVIKEQVIEFLKTVFKQNSRWENEEIDIIEIVSEEDRPLAFESYFRESEQYPVIFVQTLGTLKQELDLNNFLGEVSESQNFIPTTLNLSRTIGGASDLQQALQFSPAVSFKADRVKALLRNEGITNAPVIVQISSGSTPTEFFMASGGRDTLTSAQGIQNLAINVEPKINLATGSTYWISYSIESGSSFNQYTIFGADSVPAGSSVRISQKSGSSWTVPASGSFSSEILETTKLRLGGGNDVTVSLTTVSKDVETTEDITELIGNYLELARYTQTSQRASLRPVEGIALQQISTLTDKGIYVLSVQQGGLVPRDRGQDVLFYITITARFFGNWYYDFDVPTLRDIILTQSSFT